MSKTSAKQSEILLNDKDNDNLQAALSKALGSKSVSRLSSSTSLSNVTDWVSSRSLVVDKALAGGRPFPCSLVPFGRQMEISGMPGSGKTTLCAQIAAEVQSKGGYVVMIDTEERVAEDYWTDLGVNLDKVHKITAENLDEVFDKQAIAIKIAREQAPNRKILMIWDSVGGTALQGIDDMEAAKKVMMNKARVIGAGMELINEKMANAKVCYLYTNHLYTKPGVTYGDPYETPGGNKLKYFATVRLRLTAIGEIREVDAKTGVTRIIGNKTKVKVLKNSMAPMRLSLEGAIIGGKGFSNDWTVREVAENMKMITKAGAWSTWKTPKGEEVKFQGWQGFLDNVTTHAEYPDLYGEVLRVL